MLEAERGKLEDWFFFADPLVNNNNQQQKKTSWNTPRRWKREEAFDCRFYIDNVIYLEGQGQGRARCRRVIVESRHYRTPSLWCYAFEYPISKYFAWLILYHLTRLLTSWLRLVNVTIPLMHSFKWCVSLDRARRMLIKPFLCKYLSLHLIDVARKAVADRNP